MRLGIGWRTCILGLAPIAVACGDAPREKQVASAESGVSAARDSSATSAHVAPSPCASSLWEGVADTTGGGGRKVTRHLVSATRGMVAHLRWALSPDGCAMLVVQDPVSIEADPLPNGFLFADERGPVVLQVDSVWDVAPSVEWERLAYARAFRTRPSGSDDSVSTDEWARLATRVGVAPDVVRRAAFSCSGMAIMYCVAKPYVTRVSHRAADSAAARDTARALAILAGWRVRWRADGTTILAGIAPRGSQDNAAPARWVVIDAASGAIRDTVGAADTAGVAPIAWRDGPMLTYGVALDLASRSELPIDGGAVVSDGGWISVSWRGTGGTSPSFRVGVGRALAATRGGRFIAAIAPSRARPGQDWAYELVVYAIER